MKVVDLCCGVGGSSTGLAAAGFPVTLAVDCWDLALRSHTLNHPDAEHVLGDVRDLVGSVGRADVVVGSPPCPEFSQLGGKARTPDTSVIEAVSAIIAEAKPRFAWIENVPLAAAAMEAAGHVVQIVRASDHGLHHERRRAFAGPRHAVPATSLQPVLFQTPIASEIKAGARPHHRGREFNRLRDFLSRIPDVRDYLWAMGFPLDYAVEGGKVAQVRQINNAVCPPVAAAVAAAQARPEMATLLSWPQRNGDDGQGASS